MRTEITMLRIPLLRAGEPYTSLNTVEVADLRTGEPVVAVSHANAGLIAPGHAYTWASPAAPAILLRSLWRNDQALRFRPNLDPALWRWMTAFLTNCTAEKARTNTIRKLGLCTYSQACLRELRRVAGHVFDDFRISSLADGTEIAASPYVHEG